MFITNRRNLSGVYIFHKFNEDDRRQPTCFEDCPEEKQDEWLNSLDPEAIKSLAKHLGKTLRNIGDQFELSTESEDDE
jgi:hypothetical protein